MEGLEEGMPISNQPKILQIQLRLNRHIYFVNQSKPQKKKKKKIFLSLPPTKNQLGLLQTWCFDLFLKQNAQKGFLFFLSSLVLSSLECLGFEEHIENKGDGGGGVVYIYKYKL
jgi:hypothetical protein